MDSSSKLTDLQLDFLKIWFLQSKDFFLTGGGALVGFYGLPRTTRDVDLFTVSEEAFCGVPALLHDCCQKLGSAVVAVQTSPHFRRYRMERDQQTTLLDFVEDLAPQVYSEKIARSDGIVLDPLEEIAINKVCAIVSRSEPRDFFDLHFLVEQGLDPDVALRLANQKDGGVDIESLAMILQSMDWDGFRIPGLEVKDTAAFFKAWLGRLTLDLHPRKGPG